MSDEMLNKIKTNVLNQKKGPKTDFRTQIKRAIREEIETINISEYATIFNVSVEDIADCVAVSFMCDAIEISKLLNISIDDALLKIRGLK